MKVSTKGRYALRLMLDLAIHDTGENIALKTIAKRQGISGKYLEQIIGILAKAGFVKSVRGSSGGYRLSRPAETYTVGSILRQTEGSLAPVYCVDCDAEECEKAETCATSWVWEQVSRAISEVVDHLTLADVCRHQRELTGAEE